MRIDCISNKTCCKEPVYTIVGPGKSAICRAGQQAGNSAAEAKTVLNRWNLDFFRETSVLLLRPFK